MEKIKRISRTNLPSTTPLFQSITVWLLLDRLQANGIVTGIVWTLMGLLWVGFLYTIITTTPVDIFEEGK